MKAMSLDTEFERFKLWLRFMASPVRGDNHAAEIEAMMSDPRLRESFVRAVFAGDPKLPDVWKIR
jgi:hypothetical protein